jgi:hypothetical protein
MSYFENFKQNMYNQVGQGGSFNIMIEDYWKEKNTNGSYKYRKIGADGTDRGIDIKTFVNNVYDGSQPVCILDKIFREIGEAIGNILGAVGLGDIGCKIGRAISDAIDKVTNLLGTFICTATIENVKTGCHKDMLDVMKAYRDNIVMSDKKGIRIVKYYGLVGPRIVDAINSDINKDEVYKYLFDKYINIIYILTSGSDRNDISNEVFGLYFKMMDEMVVKYNIKVSKEFKKWVKEYTHGL